MASIKKIGSILKEKITRFYYIFLIPFLVNKTYAYAGGMQIDENGNLTLTPPATITDQGSVADQGERVQQILMAVLSGIRGVVVIFFIGLFAWKAFLLATTSTSPSERQKNVKALFNVAVGAAILGGIDFIISLTFGLLR